MARIRRATDVRSNALDKQAEKEKRSKIYNSQVIQDIIKDKSGHQDLDPFFHGLFDYRDAGIAFDYTDYELEELEKCSMDCLYFAEHYAKFKNDHGLTLVKLRDYQKRLLKLFGDETYDPENDIIKPLNQKLCLLQSRQTGKCLSLSQKIKLSNSSKVDITYFYEINNKKYNIIYFIWKKIKKKLKKYVQFVETHLQLKVIKQNFAHIIVQNKIK